MNKNKLLYVVTLAFCLLVASCSDQFLEEKKLYGVFDASTFENETQTGWFIDKVYYDFYYGLRSPGLNIVGLWEDRTALTEEKGGISDLINPNKTLETADDCSQYYGAKLSTNVTNSPYTRIRNCNFLILNIDELGTNVSDDYKKTAKGQMYFLRAIQYFDLVRMYGGVPIVTTVSNATAEDESIKYPRASVTECVNQILSDLDEAASLLPIQWPAASYGRFTREAALAMKSRVLLTYASPLFNKDWDSNNERWEAALQAGLTAETELSANGYGLYGSSAKDWSAMFLVDNSFCKEAIMVKLLSSNTATAENNSWEKTIRLSNQGGGGGLKVPKEMIDLFPMADGTRPTAENGYDEFKFFLNRDPRFYRTFAFSGCKWGYKSSPDATVWAYRWEYLNAKGNIAYAYSDANDANSPAFVRKMSNTTVDNTFDYSGTDIFEYRYAELLLNIAECYAATNNIPKCIEYLSKIRARVNIPSANNYGIGVLADKYAAIEAVLYERRVELAYEGKRALDIQRWMLYNDDASANNTTCTKLRINPVNGTCRTGHYLEYKNILTDPNNVTDPLATARKSISIDPDATSFNQDLQTLADFYTQNFVLKNPDTPMDDDGHGVALNIDWKQHYYVWGLHRTALTANSWLEQTKGWLDENNTQGTFDYQK